MGEHWRNRIQPLKKNKGSINPACIGAFAIDRRPKRAGQVTAITDGGEMHTFPSVSAFLAFALDMPAPYTWYTHLPERHDLTRAIGRHAFDGLLMAGYSVGSYETGGRAAALEVFAPDMTMGPRTPHHSVRDLRAILRNVAVPADPVSAATVTLRRVLDLHHAVHARFGVHLEMTATRTAYQAWRRTIGRHFYRLPAQARADIRCAYRGGYTRAFTTAPHHDGTWRQYDIRSAYPAAMRRGVPVGQPVRVGRDAWLRPEYRGLPGFYYAEVFLPPRGLPVLLAWSEDERRDTPTERGVPVRVWATSQELQLAEELGAAVGVLYGWVFPDGLDTPFDAFVDGCEAWRDAAQGSESDMVKLIQNTLYGKFGSNPRQKEVVFSIEPPEDAPGQERWMPHYGKNGLVPHAWERTVDADGRAGQMVHWAAWITASVRVQVIRAIVALGADNVLYVDTDCIITSGQLPTGTRYGDWVLQHVYNTFRAFAGKRYYGRTIDGRDIVKHAGIGAGSRDPVLEMALAYEAKHGDIGAQKAMEHYSAKYLDQLPPPEV